MGVICTSGVRAVSYLLILKLSNRKCPTKKVHCFSMESVAGSGFYVINGMADFIL